MSRLDTALLTPAERLTRAQERAIDRARVDRSPSFGQAASAAARTEWAGSWALHYLDTAFVPPDEAWQPTKDDWARITDGIPLNHLDEFDEAHSLAHAEAIRAKLLRINEQRAILADYGWKGTALTFGAAILDPVAIGAAFVTGGASYASTASRAARIAMIAGENAAINAGFAGLQLAQDPDMQLNDFVFAVGAGAALGTGVSEFSRALSRWGSKVTKEADAAALRRVPRHGMGSANAAGDDFASPLADALSKGESIKVFRGDQEALPGGAHLSGVQHVETILGSTAETPKAPFQFWTTSKDDAARYAVRDERIVATYEAKNPGRGAEVFKTLHGHEPRAAGTVSEQSIAPSKVFDMTSMGEKADQFTFLRLVNEAVGNDPLPEKWRWSDVPANVNALMAGKLKGAFGLGAEDAGPAYAYLRNAASPLDVELGNPAHVNHRPMAPDLTIGSDFASFLKEHGYDAVAYMHSTPTGPVKHYAMLTDESGKVIASAGSPVPKGADPLAASLSPKGRAFLRDQIAKAPLEQRRALVDEFLTASGLDPSIHMDEVRALKQMLGDPDVEVRMGDEAPDFEVPAPDDLTDVFNFAQNEGGGGGGVGGKAAGGAGEDAPKPLPPKIAGDFWARPQAGQTWRSKLRWGMSSRLGEAESPLMQAFGNTTFADVIYKKGGGASPYSWHEWAQARAANFIDEFEAAGREHVAKYRELSGKTEPEFWREVGLRMQMGFDPKKPVDSPVWRMAFELSRLQTDVLDLARRHGVKWANETTDDPSYLSRFWISNKLRATEGLLGEGGEDLIIADLFAPGLRNMNPELTIERSRQLARVIVRAIKDIHNYTDVDRARMFSVSGDDILRDAIKRHGKNLSAEDVEAIVFTARPRKGEGDGPGQLRKRIDLDINYGVRMTAADGTDLGVVHIRDFLQTDARSLFHKYAHDMVGAAGEQEVLTKMGLFADPKGGVQFKNFEELKAAMGREMDDFGVDAKKTEHLMEMVDVGRKIGRGMPLESRYTWWNEFLYRMRLFNYIRLGGTFGLAQMSEAGKLYGEFSTQVMEGAVPVFGHTLKRARDGKLDNVRLREMQAMYTPGSSRVTNQLLQRLDEDATLHALSSESRLTKTLQKGAKLTSDWSLNSWLTIDFQRKAALGAQQSLADAANNVGRPLGAKRLASLGITEAQWEKASEAMRKVMYRENGKGPWVVEWSKMAGKDAEWASILIGAIDRWSRRVSLDPDSGAMALWMTKPGAKSLLQFRGFTLQSWEKAVLHGLAMRDARTVAAFFGSAASAASIYIAQTYLDSLGQKDGEAFRREKLTARNIGAAAWSRGAYSSVLPMAWDTAAYMLGDRTPLFNTRYSGLSSVLGLDANPTSQLLFKTAPAAVKSTAQLARRQFGYPDVQTQTDRRNTGLMFPFARQYPIKLILDYWTSHGAKSEPRSQE